MSPRLLALLIALAATAGAEEPAQPAPSAASAATPAEASQPPSGAPAHAKPAPGQWRQRYTLGPGDLLDLGIHGRPDLARGKVPVLADGTINFLEANGVRADGRTIDELREDLRKALSAYHRDPRVLVYPAALRSKRFFILGKVVDKGVYTLDRPTTLLEAVARARGIETGLFERNTVELADLPRSFLMRRGQRVPVDFEALFLRGDLSQNVEMEPDDYLFFPSSNSNNVYILGSVTQPGVQGLSSRMTVVAAVAMRGGFNKSAYRSRVLVLRGALSKPETFVVDVSAILAGKEKDMLLEPKDIVFVSDRPWLVAEELVDSAINTFLQAATGAWTNRNIGPFLPSPVVPQLR